MREINSHAEKTLANDFCPAKANLLLPVATSRFTITTFFFQSHLTTTIHSFTSVSHRIITDRIKYLFATLQTLEIPQQQTPLCTFKLFANVP